MVKRFIEQVFRSLVKNKIFWIGFLLTLIWCYPYFTSGGRMALGDFSFFSQGYEAIRKSILDYGQFPWWNPWVSGGVPLYANPQFGVFSLPTLLVITFGTITGLKLTLAVFTLAGYCSMYILLRKYFKVEKLPSALLSVIWICCSFFVFHLPSHITFIWYLIAPIFIYLALTIKTTTGGIVFGLLYTVMAYTQLHNPFVHISLICAAIFGVRLIIALRSRRYDAKRILITFSVAGGLFLILSFHRLIFTYQNMHEFPRDNIDYVPSKLSVILGLILPYSKQHNLSFLQYPQHPAAPHGFGEASVTVGVFCLVALFIGIVFLIYKYLSSNKASLSFFRSFSIPLLLLVVMLVIGSIAFGAQYPLAPYTLLHKLPIISDMRLSTRWFIFLTIGLLAFIGVILKYLPKTSFAKFLIITFLVLSIAENFILNLGYQDKVFDWTPNTYSKNIKDLQFGQTSYFGKVAILPQSNIIIPHDIGMPGENREYEATTYNLGVLYANDSFVQIQLANKQSPLCSLDKNCPLIQSKNAEITDWTPNKFTLHRTSPGPIELNINPSTYQFINGKKNMTIERVAEPFKRFVITDPANIITITTSPSFKDALKAPFEKIPSTYHNYIK